MATGVAVPPEVRERISNTKRMQAVRGSDHKNAVLTESDVLEIVYKRKVLQLSENRISQDYDVSRSTISAILRGWTWGHVTGLGEGRCQKRSYVSRLNREGLPS